MRDRRMTLDRRIPTLQIWYGLTPAEISSPAAAHNRRSAARSCIGTSIGTRSATSDVSRFSFSWRMSHPRGRVRTSHPYYGAKTSIPARPRKNIFSRRHAGIGKPMPLIRQEHPTRPRPHRATLKQSCLRFNGKGEAMTIQTKVSDLMALPWRARSAREANADRQPNGVGPPPAHAPARRPAPSTSKTNVWRRVKEKREWPM